MKSSENMHISIDYQSKHWEGTLPDNTYVHQIWEHVPFELPKLDDKQAKLLVNGSTLHDDMIEHGTLQDIQMIMQQPLRFHYVLSIPGGNLLTSPEFKIRDFIRLLVTGFFQYGWVFLFAWFFITWLIQHRIGGAMPSPQILNNPVLNTPWSNGSVPLIPPSYGHLDPMEGSIPIGTNHKLVFFGVLSIVAFFWYHFTAYNLNWSTYRQCGKPEFVDLLKRLPNMFGPFIILGGIVWFAGRKRTNVQEWSNTHLNPLEKVLEYSVVILMSVLSLFMILDGVIGWANCMQSFLTLVVPLVGIGLLGGAWKFGKSIYPLITRIISFFFGINVTMDTLDKSMFARVVWMILVSVPIAGFYTLFLPPAYVYNLRKICGV